MAAKLGGRHPRGYRGEGWLRLSSHKADRRRDGHGLGGGANAMDSGYYKGSRLFSAAELSYLVGCATREARSKAAEFR